MSLEHEEMFDFAYITHYMTSKALCICLHHYSRDTYQSRHNYLVWHNVLNTETHKCIFLWSLRNIHYIIIIWHHFCICKGGIQIRMQRKTVIGCSRVILFVFYFVIRCKAGKNVYWWLIIVLAFFVLNIPFIYSLCCFKQWLACQGMTCKIKYTYENKIIYEYLQCCICYMMWVR